MRETTLKAKEIYERLLALHKIAIGSGYQRPISQRLDNWREIYIEEEYQDIMNDADVIHKELQKQWDEEDKAF